MKIYLIQNPILGLIELIEAENPKEATIKYYSETRTIKNVFTDMEAVRDEMIKRKTNNCYVINVAKLKF